MGKHGKSRSIVLKEIGKGDNQEGRYLMDSSHNILLDVKKNMENWIKVGAVGEATGYKWMQMAYKLGYHL